jgi:predicted phage terminase large subunit-like protein
MKTAGRGGPITGFGADLAIADDLLKNSEEANSQTIRDSTWDWWQTTFITRLEPGASVVSLATRWHEDDPIGRVAAEEERAVKNGEESEGWQFFVFPAVAEGLGKKPDGTPNRDALGRKDGDALWPERYDERAMARIKKAVGPIAWNALYQQSPVPPDGDFFRREWLRTYQIENQKMGDPLSGNVVIQTIDGKFQSYPIAEMMAFLVADTAMTTKKENDATAIGSFWITPKRQLILKRMFHGRMSGPDVEKKLLNMYREDQCSYMAIEDRANGITALQKFMDIGINAKKLKAISDKVTRAIPLQVMLEQGRVFLPADMPGYQYDVLLKEFLKFPKGQHDDIVDMMAHAAGVLSEYTYDTDGEATVYDAEFTGDPSGRTYLKHQFASDLIPGFKAPADRQAEENVFVV